MDTFWEDPLTQGVLRVDPHEVRRLLDKCSGICKSSPNKETLLHVLTGHCGEATVVRSRRRRHIVYMLHQAGVDLNAQDQNGDTALHHLVKNLNGDPEICEALLQCGADMFVANKVGESFVSLVETGDKMCAEGKEVCRKYWPGLWRAVESDDLMSLRKLINMWCFVDIQKDGKTLRQLACEKGTENIIRLIIEIDQSLRLAHDVLAWSFTSTRNLLNKDGAKININLKNMGHKGATPLYYAVHSGNVDLVKLLRAKGAKLDTDITSDGQDVPLFITALRECTTPEAIERLLVCGPHPVYTEHIKSCGRNSLFYCIQNNVHPEATKAVIKHSGYKLLTDRDQNNLTPRDYAADLHKTIYVNLIDERVISSCLDNDSEFRKGLALVGYPYIRTVSQRVEESLKYLCKNDEQDIDERKLYMDHLYDYQDHIRTFMEAVESGDVNAMDGLCTYRGPGAEAFFPCVLPGKATGDGQTAFHKAVLRRDLHMVAALAENLTTKTKVRLDDMRDQYDRTALHYAYALESGKRICNTLLDFGASEYTMDKDDRSPLVFRERREHPAMKQLLEQNLYNMVAGQEPDPWTGPIPRYVHSDSCSRHKNPNMLKPEAEHYDHNEMTRDYAGEDDSETDSGETQSQTSNSCTIL